MRFEFNIDIYNFIQNIIIIILKIRILEFF